MRDCVKACETLQSTIRATSDAQLGYFDDMVGPLAAVVLAQRRAGEAESIVRPSRDELSLYVRGFPSHSWGIMSLAEQQYICSDVCVALNKHDDAEQALRETWTLLQTLTRPALRG